MVARCHRIANSVYSRRVAAISPTRAGGGRRQAPDAARHTMDAAVDQGWPARWGCG